MNYAEKLLENIPLANSHILQGRKAIEEIIQFFKSVAFADENYAKVLENLSNFQFIILRGSLHEALTSIKRDISHKATQLRAFTENLTQDIIKPLQLLVNSSIEQAKSLSQEAQKTLKFKERYYEKLNRYKEKFWKSCNDCEKMTQILEQPQSQILREKSLEKLVKTKNSLDAHLKEYQDHIDAWDNFTSMYRPLLLPILQGYEKTELNRLESTKDQLRKYIVYEASFIRNLQYEIDSLAKCMEELDTAKDLEELVQTPAKTMRPEFENYKGTHQAYRNVDSSGLVFAIPLPVQEAKWSEIVFQGSLEEMYRTEIDIISLKACQGYELGSEDFAQFNSLIKDSLGRKAWVWSMESKKSQTLLNEKGFAQLGELMLSVLNECERKNDIYTTKVTIQYSQLFYKETLDHKETLAKCISSHSLWAKSNIWEKVAEGFILDDIASHDLYSVAHKEEDRKKLIGNIVFCQLGVMAETMKSFGISQEVSAETIGKLAGKYDLPPADISVLMLTVKGKREKEVGRVMKVQRGIPAWLQELEGTAAAMTRRVHKPLSEYLSQEKNNN